MKDKNMRSLRLMTFEYVVLLLEFSRCRDAEKSGIPSNFSIHELDQAETFDLHLLLGG